MKKLDHLFIKKLYDTILCFYVVSPGGHCNIPNLFIAINNKAQSSKDITHIIIVNIYTGYLLSYYSGLLNFLDHFCIRFLELEKIPLYIPNSFFTTAVLRNETQMLARRVSEHLKFFCAKFKQILNKDQLIYPDTDLAVKDRGLYRV